MWQVMLTCYHVFVCSIWVALQKVLGSVTAQVVRESGKGRVPSTCCVAPMLGSLLNGYGMCG